MQFVILWVDVVEREMQCLFRLPRGGPFHFGALISMQPVLNPRLPDKRLSVCIMWEARSFEENELPSYGRISTRFAYDLRHSVPSGMGDEVSVSRKLAGQGRWHVVFGNESVRSVRRWTFES